MAKPKWDKRSGAGKSSSSSADKPRKKKLGWTKLVGTLLLVLVVGSLGYLLALTALTSNRLPNPGASDLRGMAVVRSCTEAGPVSASGFGTYQRCSAEVTWDSGLQEVRDFDGSELTLQDKDKQVRVVKVTTPPYQWLPAPESYQREGGDRAGEWSETLIYAIVGAVLAVSAAAVLGGLLSLLRPLFTRTR